MEHIERIDKLEKEVRVTQDSVLLIHNDLKQMSGAMTKMANSMEAMATLQTNMKVMEERCEARHNALKDADKTLHLRLDGVNAKIKDLTTEDKELKTKADKGSSAWTIIVWAGGIFGSAFILWFLGVMIWAIQNGAKVSG